MTLSILSIFFTSLPETLIANSISLFCSILHCFFYCFFLTILRRWRTSETKTTDQPDCWKSSEGDASQQPNIKKIWSKQSSTKFSMLILPEEFGKFVHFLALFYVTILWMIKQIWDCPVGWGCRIHRLFLCRRVRHPPLTSVLDITLNNLMVRFQQCWSFGECRVPLHCHCSQVHSCPEW